MLGGCGPYPQPPVPSPTTTRTIGATTRVPPYAGAPAVRDPLPVTVVSGEPCTTALTPGQVRQVLGAEVMGKIDREESPGRTCLWENRSTGTIIRVAFATRHRQGLSAVYPARSPDEGWVWRELRVAGFPAVATTPEPDQPWYCTVVVGLADDVAVEVSMVTRTASSGDQCTLTGQTAELVVATLRKRAGR
ncbi:hypothetical protein BS329_15905 [Amycolatopsis coloradensis]|uniref:DUF3558 domain-containing protein n=2 Tax=Amycolatopsis coloradensis TaxID=76021 RepID=A0A1R0KUH1_9PSEU|nr:hypothetical protein BS329_15905 [Amycolatopsis coloradensis]